MQEAQDYKVHLESRVTEATMEWKAKSYVYSIETIKSISTDK